MNVYQNMEASVNNRNFAHILDDLLCGHRSKYSVIFVEVNEFETDGKGKQPEILR